MTNTVTASGDFKVRLVGPSDTVWFESSPIISEDRHANYNNYDITHLPTELFYYRNTSARKFNITGKFISRNIDEAILNMRYLDLIRSWMQPTFGGGVGAKAGATPPILKLFAYNNQNINGIPVILKSYSWQWNDDVDYVYNAVQKIPIIGTVNINLEESWSPAEIMSGAWKMQITDLPDSFKDIKRIRDINSIGDDAGFDDSNDLHMQLITDANQEYKISNKILSPTSTTSLPAANLNNTLATSIGAVVGSAAGNAVGGSLGGVFGGAIGREIGGSLSGVVSGITSNIASGVANAKELFADKFGQSGTLSNSNDGVNI